MANYVSTSLSIIVQLLDSTGEAIYTGNNDGIFLWGAQLELGVHPQVMIDDAQNYQYIRTRGIKSSSKYLQLNHDWRTDWVDQPDHPTLNLRLDAKKAGVREIVQLRINSNKILDAAQIEELFVNQPRSNYGKKWFQLAPYYKDYARDERLPTDRDLVRVGSLNGGLRTAPNPYETIAFYQIPKNPNDQLSATDPVKVPQFINKVFAETKTIPSGSRYDAARVAEVFTHYKTAQSIDTVRYTPISGSTTLYKSYDWYSMTPLSKIAKFAYGQGDQLGPIMHEVFEFADTLTFTQTYKLPPDYQIISDGSNRNIMLYAKRALYSDYYTKSNWSTSSVAAQTADVFVNYKASSYYGKAWYKLSPYYGSFTHTYDSAQSVDYVSTSRENTNLNVIQDYAMLNALEDLQTSTAASEDYQLIPN